MGKSISYREIQAGEETQACQLVSEVFNEFIAPGYSKEGVIEFSKYLEPRLMRDRLARNHFIFVALDDAKIVGVIEVRGNNHVSLLYVKKNYQNKSIAKKLLKLALNKSEKVEPPASIEVNSSPYAVTIYEKLGFIKKSSEKNVNGIRFTPMILRLA